MKHVVVAGATGLIGQQLLKQLTVEHCQHVTALSRRKINLPHSNQSVLLVDYSDLTLEPALDESSVVICALGTTIKTAGSKKAFAAVDYDMVINLANQALSKGYKHFVVVSSLGADKPGSNFYLQTKHKMESSLFPLPFTSLTIVRPSLLLGARGEFRLGEKMGELAAKVFAPILKGKLLKYRPIQASKVSNAILTHLKQSPKGHCVIDNTSLHKLGKG
ncbi:NAD(P)H-binding protein [Reinekea forsetii]|nr:NAD(P)H-binding protein [Reinekea forsetii]